MATDALKGIEWIGWVLIGFAALTLFLILERIFKKD
jgi:hypothetical protein